MQSTLLRFRGSSGKEKFLGIAVLAVLLLAAILFCMLSPLNPWENGEASTDSSVFKTVVMYMENGMMPYTDTFDHKGPLIYLLNWLGNRISYYQGIWFIEVFSLFITLVFSYKTARFFCSRLFSLGTLVIVIASLTNYFEGGNFTEEYAMPFIAVSVFIFADYFLNDTITRFRLCACGFCFGAVLLLRPNMIAVWFVFCLAVLIRTLKAKDFRELGRYLIFFIIGALVIMLPIVIWLVVNGALADMIQTYLLFNSEYAAKSADGGLTAKIQAFYTFFKNVFVIGSLICAGVLACRKRDIFHIAYFLCILVTLAFLSMSGQTYGHYGMILVPLEAYPFAAMMQEVQKMLFSERRVTMVLLLCGFFMAKAVLPSWLYLGSSAVDSITDGETITRSEKTAQTVEIVEACTSEDDTITVLGNWDIVYVLTQRMPASRYSYQSPISSVKTSIIDEYFEDLEESQPALIIITSTYTEGDTQYDRMMEFIDTNGYVLLTDEIESLLIYIAGDHQ